MKRQKEGGFLITKIHHLSGRIFSRKLKEFNLDEINPAQGRILFALWRGDGISIQELAKRTLLGKSTLTSMLDRLEKNGYITRLSAGKDRRKVIIKLTEKDRKLQGVYIQLSKEMTDLFYKGFKVKEIDEFEDYLRRILDNLISIEKAGN